MLAAGTNSCRAKASGNLSVAQVEAIVDEKCGDMQTYSPWFDHHLALFSSSGLNSYTTAFDRDGVKYMALNSTFGCIRMRPDSLHSNPHLGAYGFVRMHLIICLVLGHFQFSYNTHIELFREQIRFSQKHFFGVSLGRVFG